MDTENGAPLGGLAAERDPLLESCFVRSNLIETALSFGNHSNIVIGKKGSGKSAIFKVGLSPTTAIPCVRISPTAHVVNVALPSLNYRRYAHNLKYELAIESLRTLAQDDYVKEHLGRGDRTRLTTAANEYIKRVQDAAERIREVSLLGAGLGIADTSKKLADLGSVRDYESLSPLFEKLKAIGARCLVMIDDPELLFATGDETPINLIAGLLFAAVEISSDFFNVAKVVVFLKSHIYEHLVTALTDIDHLRDNFLMLRWNQADLEKLLAERVAEAVRQGAVSAMNANPWSTLLGSRSKKESLKLCRYFADRLICGPRDLIRFANLILDWRRKGARRWEAVNLAEARYSEEQLTQLRLQYGQRDYPGIENIVAKIFDTDEVPSKGEFRPDTLLPFMRKRLVDEQLIALRKMHAWLEELAPNRLAELFFRVSVLGYWSPSQKRYVLPYEEMCSSREFKAATKHRINPAFFTELGIK